MNVQATADIRKVKEEYDLLVNRFHGLIDSGGSFEQVKTVYGDLKILRSMMEYLMNTDNDINKKHDTDADVGDAIPLQEK
jgi:hypothetical protein